MNDVTQQVQAQFNQGNYDLTAFDGQGITSVTLKHPDVKITASNPVVIHMLPLMHPTKPGVSKSVPMFSCDTQAGSPDIFGHISFSRNISINGSFPDNVPFVELNQAKADPMGLARNIFDQIRGTHIHELYWDAETFDCSGAVVSFSSAGKAIIRGYCKNIGTKVCGIAYNASDYPMFVDFSPRYVNNVNSVIDFSAPGPLKSVIKNHVPVGYAHDFVATNVYGRSKTAAYWNVTLERVNIHSLPWPSPVQYSGFTVTEPLQNFRAQDFYSKNFLRAGLELRSPGGPCHIDGVITENSLNDVLINGGANITNGAKVVPINCKNAGSVSTDWVKAVEEAKAVALTYGKTINFP